MKYDKVVICNVNTLDLKELKGENKIELIKLSQKGDKKARDKLIKGNLKLVLSIIQKFNNRGEFLDDLFQVGCIGLIKSIDNFDTAQNVQFSTYAVPMIIGEIKRYLRDNSHLIKISRSLKDIAYKTIKTKEHLTKLKNREPTIEEISKEIDVPKDKIILALESIADPVSLYERSFTNHNSDDNLYIMDQICENTTESDLINELAIKQAISNLKNREKNFLLLRFLKGKTQSEIANELGISQAQISRMEKSILSKIMDYT